MAARLLNRRRRGTARVMDTTEIIWIAVAVAVVVALVALARMLLSRKRERAAEGRREHATELRREASKQAHLLHDAQLRAEEERLKAERLQLEAERAQEHAQEAQTSYLQEAAQHEDRLREADRIDPDA